MTRWVLAAALSGAVLGAVGASAIAWHLHSKQVAEARRLQSIVDVDRDAAIKRDEMLADQLTEVRRRVDALERR